MTGSTLTYKIQDTHKIAKRTSYSNSGVVICHQWISAGIWYEDTADKKVVLSTAPAPATHTQLRDPRATFLTVPVL